MNGRLDHPFTAFYIGQNRLMFKNSLRRLDGFYFIGCVLQRTTASSAQPT
jgi:hypothetical protein